MKSDTSPRLDAAIVVPVPASVAPSSVLIVGSRDLVPVCMWRDARDADVLGGLVEQDAPIPWWLGDVAKRLDAYFAGEPVDFSDVPLGRETWDAQRGAGKRTMNRSDMPFMQRCWHACRRIPRGRTITYRDLAIAAGGPPRAARAAGQAMRRNPLPIITPCHRVVGTNWTGGYGGAVQRDTVGLQRKIGLLALEGAPISRSR